MHAGALAAAKANASLALIASVCITAPSSAQKGQVTARSAQADMEKAYGPDHRDVAASLTNLALLYG